MFVQKNISITCFYGYFGKKIFQKNLNYNACQVSNYKAKFN